MKAFLLLSPGTSWERAILRRILRWSIDDVHETTDVGRVECSADLLEVKGAKMISKSSPWITGRDTLGLSTTAETATSRRAAGSGLYLRSDRSGPSVYNERACQRRAETERVVGLGPLVTGMEMQ